MDSLFDEKGTARFFEERLRKTIGDVDQERVRSMVAAATPSELDAWARYGLTHYDGVLGSDEAAWAARLAALETLDAYRLAVGQAQHQTAASTDTGTATNCVWMDNTTLAGAVALVLGRTKYVASTTLIDLESFVRAAVLYDHVICLPPQQDLGLYTLNESLRERILAPIFAER